LSFYDACDQLGGPRDGISMEATLAPLRATLETRSKCRHLPLSASRGFRMYELVLGYVTRGEPGEAHAAGKNGSDA
jgi:hypothetical protein